MYPSTDEKDRKIRTSRKGREARPRVLAPHACRMAGGVRSALSLQLQIRRAGAEAAYRRPGAKVSRGLQAARETETEGGVKYVSSHDSHFCKLRIA